MNVREWHPRADILALERIDAGTLAERQEFGERRPLHLKRSAR
jgi:hypothetical protein